MSNDMSVLLESRGLGRTYRLAAVEIPVLRDVTMQVYGGEFVAIEGASGSGKSTLLHLLGALDTPDAGDVLFEGRSVFSAATGRRDQLRTDVFGFVFQFYHLLPELSVLENVLIPRMVRHSSSRWLMHADQARRDAADLLDQMGLGHRLGHVPAQLSGGERQRVAIARALINRPRVLLADEPTGNLDRSTGREILEVLSGVHRMGQTVVMVTHDPAVAGLAQRRLQLTDGRIESSN